MMITARCRCTQRTIDTDKVGPWRLRCKTCHEIIYDPQAAAAATAAKKAAGKNVTTETTDDEKTQFNDFLQASNELKVLMSSEGEPDQRPCPKHPKYKIVAACGRCEKLLCKKCLDRVGDAFTCGDCVEKQLLQSKEAASGGGLLGFLRRLFGRGR